MKFLYGISMKIHFLIALFLWNLMAPTSIFADEVVIAYEYTLKPQVDFSKATKGPLKVAKFTDTRDVSDSRLLIEDRAEKPVPDIVNDALIQAFKAGGASLVEEGQSLTLEGEVTELSIMDKAGGKEITIRTNVTLKRGSQIAFKTAIFGRATGDTVDQAMRATLDRLVNSLILDDYFLMEVL